jgi:hypothetical protein
MKPNWVCSVCGMWSNRKFSVKRHIANKHNGNALLIAFIDYLVGRQSGLYLPSSLPPSFQPAYQKKEEKTYLEIFNEEYWKEKARIAARKEIDKVL